MKARSKTTDESACNSGIDQKFSKRLLRNTVHQLRCYVVEHFLKRSVSRDGVTAAATVRFSVEHLKFFAVLSQENFDERFSTRQTKF